MSWAISTGIAVEKFARAAVSQWDDDLARDWECLYARTIGHKQRASRLLGKLLRYPAITHPAISFLTKTSFLASAAARGISSMDLNI
jgi:hypothetical protein